jgi:hypothetical protein
MMAPPRRCELVFAQHATINLVILKRIHNTHGIHTYTKAHTRRCIDKGTWDEQPSMEPSMDEGWRKE